MKITDALLGEHGAIYALLDHVDRGAPRWTSLDEAREASASLAAALFSHAAAEEELLFEVLEPVIGSKTGPLAVLRREHAEIEAVCARSLGAELEECRELLSELTRLARDHFAKEEGILFPLAERQLGDAALTDLGRRWAKKRRVSLGA